MRNILNIQFKNTIMSHGVVFLCAFRMSHIPVLLDEVVDMLQLQDGDKVLDATFGGGGHSEAILMRTNCGVLAIDRDPEAKDRAMKFKERFAERFDFVPAKFSEIPNLIFQKYDAVLFDFGVSSFQLDDAKRGFSFSLEGQLDMRMSKNQGISAFDVVNSFREDDLADIIFRYGDEPSARKISKAIVKERQNKQIVTTLDLRNIIHSVVKRKPNSKIDPATKTFQAIRIFVNDELKEINDGLIGILRVLNDGARIATIAFHALEDRIVKNWSRSEQSITPINKNSIKPTIEEIKRNPRSRSAILRGFIFSKAD